MQYDVVVPYHVKDRPVLGWCIRGIRANVPAARIIVVCAKEAVEDVRTLGAEVVDEDEVVPGLSFRSYTFRKWGWYFQQILKFGMSRWVHTDRYLVVDSDTVFLRPMTFEDEQNRMLFATSGEYAPAYFETFRILLGWDADREFSFVNHHMLFDRGIVDELTGRMSTAESWWRRIIGGPGPNPTGQGLLRFSEYETYGHYVKQCYPDRFLVRRLAWTTCCAAPSERLLRRLSRAFDFCSFHSHLLLKRAGRFSGFLARLRTHVKLTAHALGLRNCDWGSR